MKTPFSVLLACGICLPVAAWLPKNLAGQNPGVSIAPHPPASSFAPGGGGIPITSLPFVIDQCGTYFLASCLTGPAGSDGIVIDADFVTLDLNGLTLFGSPGSLNGIQVGFNSTLRSCSSSLNDQHGFFISAGCLIVDCNSFSNGLGGIRALDGNSIRRCLAYANSGAGLYLENRNNAVEGNQAIGNSNANFFLADSNNLLRQNCSFGASISYSIAPGNHNAAILNQPGAAFLSDQPWANFED
ncbi:MAG: hypothetical protein DWQ01_06905 [Planctomycetota bacterium]|nr:MAG: hypothetical protein DWQ01_06905 [Planctomycetota bacterium]